MRAQNEPPETRRPAQPAARVGRCRRRDPTAARRAARAARRRTRWLERASSGRRAAARSSPGSRSGRGRASGRSTSAPRRAARRRSSPARSSRSRSTRAGRASSRRTARGSARRTSRVVHADALELPPELDRLRPRARRRAVLRARRAGRAARPALAGASRCPSSSWRSCARPRSGCGPAARSRTRSARSTPRRTRRSSTRCGLEPDDARRRVAALPPSGAGRSSCSRCPHVHRTSGFFIARLRSPRLLGSRAWRWSDWVRDGVEVEPSLYAADFARLGEQVELLPRRRRAASSTSTSATGTSSSRSRSARSCCRSIAPLVHERGGVLDCHLMVDDPAQAHPADRGGRRRQRHLPRRGGRRRRRSIALAREHGLGVGVAFNPGTAGGRRGRAADGRRPRPLHEHLAGYSGQAFMPEALARIARAAEPLPEEVHVQVDGGVGRGERRASCAQPGATLLVAGTSIFGAGDPARRVPRARRRAGVT